MLVFNKSMLLRSLAVSVEERLTDAVVSVGQCILIEGDDNDNPYVAQLIKLFSDGKARCFRLSLHII